MHATRDDIQHFIHDASPMPPDIAAWHEPLRYGEWEPLRASRAPVEARPYIAKALVRGIPIFEGDVHARTFYSRADHPGAPPSWVTLPYVDQFLSPAWMMAVLFHEIGHYGATLAKGGTIVGGDLPYDELIADIVAHDILLSFGADKPLIRDTLAKIGDHTDNQIAAMKRGGWTLNRDQLAWIKQEASRRTNWFLNKEVMRHAA